jgi:DNA-binding SARP family transcriptional activator
MGEFDLLVGSRRVDRAEWRRTDALRLVKLLLVTPGHRIARAQATEILWPSRPPGVGDAALRKALHYARRALGSPDAIMSVGPMIQLGPARVEVDMDELDRARPAGRREPDTLLDLGSLELLPDDLDEDWLLAPREALRRAWGARALAMARALLESGGTHRAHALVDRLLERDPADEAAHRLAMELYASEGRHEACRRQFDACRSAVREAVDAEPMWATVETYLACMGRPPEDITARSSID